MSPWVEADDEPRLASFAPASEGSDCGKAAGEGAVFAALLLLLSVLSVFLLAGAANGFHPAAVWLRPDHGGSFKERSLRVPAGTATPITAATSLAR